MFKDTDEALARLEAELLREEEEELLEEEYEAYEEEPEEEENLLPPDMMYEDTRPSAGPVIYQNYSNNYGQNLRNYAGGYHAYNADISDEDLEEYSEDLLDEEEEEKNNTSLILVACVLCLSIVAVLLVWMFLFQGGLR